ncbi:hypothetical protein EW145_g2062 [Phellinidium pouzarii]|uniref:TFIIB-type domain-containing protein n=1 Tax=Phellinidium pouzarii TaxID=167371 RepID=A0A4S4LCG6_9AGAM|nr:hypothetical protein EW145_g2062 [Phellinidium pouzarii]
MRADRCGECGDEFVWDSDAGSAVCLACGTLQDPSQVVLDAHIEPADNDKDRYGLPFEPRSTLKAFRNSNGWDLAGQGKHASAERNKFAMRQYTVALASRIGHSSLSTRALYLFELAMQKGAFRYGRKARLVAGACLAIALREGQKGETISDIAYFLDETPVALARVFTSVITLLDVQLTSVDPSWHFPVLQRQLIALLAEHPPVLPQILIKILKSIHLPSALRTASSLSDLVSRSGLLTNVPSPPTACAIYTLALEGEALTSLPHCGKLAQALGRRFGVSKDVVMRRYKTIYEQVERWARNVPWLADCESPDGNKTKAAKRVVVARCLKDAVQFHERVWRLKLEAPEPPSVPDNVDSVSSPEISSNSEVDLQRDDEELLSQPSQSRKRRKTRHIDDVSQFLLSPLHAGSSIRPGLAESSLEIASHLLASDMPCLNKPPTRLQLLATEKSPEEITDEELFDEGELDGFLRSPEERDILLLTCNWSQEKGSDNGEKRPDRAPTSAHERRCTSRMNVEAFNRLMNEPDEASLVEAMHNDDDDDDDDDDSIFNSLAEQIMSSGDQSQIMCYEDNSSGTDENNRLSSPLIDVDDGEVVGLWRPLSPGV